MKPVRPDSRQPAMNARVRKVPDWTNVYFGGGSGQDGYVYIEFFDPNFVVLNSKFQALIDALISKFPA